MNKGTNVLNKQAASVILRSPLLLDEPVPIPLKYIFVVNLALSYVKNILLCSSLAPRIEFKFILSITMPAKIELLSDGLPFIYF